MAQQDSLSNKFEREDLAYVAKYILVFNIYKNSYEVSDRDMMDLQMYHYDYILTYYPILLDSYDLTLYSKFALAGYLYNFGKEDYLLNLYMKYKHIFGDEKEIKAQEGAVPIIFMLDNLGIEWRNFSN